MRPLRCAGREVAHYRSGEGLPDRLAPRPHLHPVLTLGGVPVTESCPADHPHHLGVGVAVPDVLGHNFWGGRTFVRGRGPTELDNHGTQARARLLWEGDGGYTEELAWTVPAGASGAFDASGAPVASRTSAVSRAPVASGAVVPDGAPAASGGGRSGSGRNGDGTGAAGRDAAGPGGVGRDGERELVREVRTVAARPLASGGWALDFTFTLTNTSGAPLSIGSPATNGRPGAGYGGFFWRAPLGGVPPLPFTRDAEGEAAVHGRPAPWLALAAPGWTLVFAGATERTRRDPWFVRAHDYPGVGSCLAWAHRLPVPPGGTVTRHIVTAVADGRLDRAAAERTAAELTEAPAYPLPADPARPDSVPARPWSAP